MMMIFQALDLQFQAFLFSILLFSSFLLSLILTNNDIMGAKRDLREISRERFGKERYKKVSYGRYFL